MTFAKLCISVLNCVSDTEIKVYGNLILHYTYFFLNSHGMIPQNLHNIPMESLGLALICVQYYKISIILLCTKNLSKLLHISNITVSIM